MMHKAIVVALALCIISVQCRRRPDFDRRDIAPDRRRAFA